MKMEIQKSLKTLQANVRAEGKSIASVGRSGEIPERLVTPEAGGLNVGIGVSREIRQLVSALLEDEHYEHLGDTADAAVWDFVCDCAINRSTDHVRGFIQAHRRELTTYVIQFAVDHLGTTVPQTVDGVEFLALPDENTDDGKHLRRDNATGCVAQVAVTGTDPHRATERGRERVRHTLAVLRVSFANAERGFHANQLRFRLGQMYIIDQGHGFSRHKDAAFPITFDRPMKEALPNLAVISIPFDGKTDIQKRLALAVSWLDAAHMDASPIHRVGFLFTALEAMLGDQSEGLKAPALVFYRTALGHAVKGMFPDPYRLYFLYEQVRSYATHGEAAEVTDDDVSYLDWNIRETMFELVAFCAERNLTKRSQVRRELLKDGVDQLTLDFLQSNGPREWWDGWTPGPKPAKDRREKQLSAEVETLKAKVEELERQLAEVSPPATPQD